MNYKMNDKKLALKNEPDESGQKDSLIDEDHSVKAGGLLIKIHSRLTQVGKDSCIIFGREGTELSMTVDGDQFYSTTGGKHTSKLSNESCSDENCERFEFHLSINYSCFKF